VCIRLQCARVPPWGTSSPISDLRGVSDTYRIYRLMYCNPIGDGPSSPSTNWSDRITGLQGALAMYSELIALADD